MWIADALLGLLNLPGFPAQLTTQIEVDPCPVGGLSCNQGDLAGYVNQVFLGGNALYLAFFGVFFGMLVFYALRLVALSHEENTVSETINAYTQALIGAILVSGAAVIAQSFTGSNADVVDSVPLEVGFFQQVIVFVIRLVAFVLLANVVVQGIRMIIAIDENNVEAARRNLLLSVIGTVIVMIAAPILSLVLPGAFNVGINTQIVGIANFIATLFGLLAVVAFIVAGIMLVISVDENLKEKAKKLMLSAVVAMGVVVLAFGLIQLFL